MSLEFESENNLGPEGPHFSGTDEGPEAAPWTEISPGRYMPRRVRGSYHGRALG